MDFEESNKFWNMVLAKDEMLEPIQQQLTSGKKPMIKTIKIQGIKEYDDEIQTVLGYLLYHNEIEVIQLLLNHYSLVDDFEIWQPNENLEDPFRTLFHFTEHLHFKKETKNLLTNPVLLNDEQKNKLRNQFFDKCGYSFNYYPLMERLLEDGIIHPFMLMSNHHHVPFFYWFCTHCSDLSLVQKIYKKYIKPSDNCKDPFEVIVCDYKNYEILIINHFMKQWNTTDGCQLNLICCMAINALLYKGIFGPHIVWLTKISHYTEWTKDTKWLDNKTEEWMIDILPVLPIQTLFIPAESFTSSIMELALYKNRYDFIKKCIGRPGFLYNEFEFLLFKNGIDYSWESIAIYCELITQCRKYKPDFLKDLTNIEQNVLEEYELQKGKLVGLSDADKYKHLLLPYQIFYKFVKTNDLGQFRSSILSLPICENNQNDNDETKEKIYETQELNSDKKILVIDLDETMIHTELYNVSNEMKLEADLIIGFPSISNTYYPYINKTYKSKLIQHAVNVENSQGIRNFPMIHIVKLRPGLKEFLNKVKEHYEVILWTRALPRYANAIIDYIDPNNEIFKRRLYRQDCLSDGTKDIGKLGYDLTKVLLLDDAIDHKHHQPNNFIQIPPFFWKWTPNDNVLFHTWILLEKLSKVNDVREHIPSMSLMSTVSQETLNEINKMMKQRI